MDRQLVYTVPCYASNTLGKLQQQYQRGENCDLVVRVRGSCFLAHRCVVLAVMRKVEVKMIENGLYALDINDFSTSAIKALLDMMYSGELHCDPVLVERVTEAAIGLGFEEAVRGCKLYTSMNQSAVSGGCTIDIEMDQRSVKVKQEPDDIYGCEADTFSVGGSVSDSSVGPAGDLNGIVQFASLNTSVKIETDEVSETAAVQELARQKNVTKTASYSIQAKTSKDFLPKAKKKGFSSTFSQEGSLQMGTKVHEIAPQGRRSSRIRQKTLKSYTEPTEDDLVTGIEGEVPVKRHRTKRQWSKSKQGPGSIYSSENKLLNTTEILLERYKPVSTVSRFNDTLRRMSSPAYPGSVIEKETELLSDNDDDEDEEEGIPVYNYVAGNHLTPAVYKPGPQPSVSTDKKTQRTSRGVTTEMNTSTGTSSSDEEVDLIRSDKAIKLVPGSAIVPKGVRSKYCKPRIIPAVQQKPAKVKQKIYICHPQKPVVRT